MSYLVDMWNKHILHVYVFTGQYLYLLQSSAYILACPLFLRLSHDKHLREMETFKQMYEMHLKHILVIIFIVVN